jgi:hypothetical protein
MKIARSLIANGRKHQLQLPAGWCARHGITAGNRVRLLVPTDDGPLPLPLIARRAGRGLRVTLPASWCTSEGLLPGDPVLLLEVEPGLLTLQVIEGASEKELRRRGEVVMRMHITREQQESRRREQGRFREGRNLGRMEALGIHFQNRNCFDPAHWQEPGRA